MFDTSKLWQEAETVTMPIQQNVKQREKEQTLH